MRGCLWLVVINAMQCRREGNRSGNGRVLGWILGPLALDRGAEYYASLGVTSH